MWKIAVLTSSDQGALGQRVDTSGAYIKDAVRDLGEVVAYQILPDDEKGLVTQLRAWVDAGMDLILTTGGTGLGPRDNMPEATRQVIDREIPGMSEAMRYESLKHTPMGMLSRGVCGQKGRTLIVNLPGSLKAVQELLPVILPVLNHALMVIHGQTEHKN
ncbi:MAG: molybdenum cofactor biosynthesis protein [Sulfobacillus thermosulfidooxidans]|uniref:Molybdenum cofactor biosynthesis protein n=1 Tax=Sulfobacillus thermosulfidooxidans TaxID=28034 RepID=A0A2T2X154_SULTH|nr:MAG: molybdenum cofactor biosynthesis protein [Sulfobacillus thermosulfidooxidans]